MDEEGSSVETTQQNLNEATCGGNDDALTKECSQAAPPNLESTQKDTSERDAIMDRDYAEQSYYVHAECMDVDMDEDEEDNANNDTRSCSPFPTITNVQVSFGNSPSTGGVVNENAIDERESDDVTLNEAQCRNSTSQTNQGDNDADPYDDISDTESDCIKIEEALNSPSRMRECIEEEVQKRLNDLSRRPNDIEGGRWPPICCDAEIRNSSNSNPTSFGLLQLVSNQVDNKFENAVGTAANNEVHGVITNAPGPGHINSDVQTDSVEASVADNEDDDSDGSTLSPSDIVISRSYLPGRRTPFVINIDEEEEEFSELDIASDSDIPDNPIEDWDSSSESPNVDDLLQTTSQWRSNNPGQIVPRRNAELECNSSEAIADNSARDSATLTLTKRRHKCSQCDASVLSVFNYCLRCFKIRRTWLPKRPPSRRLKLRKRLATNPAICIRRYTERRNARRLNSTSSTNNSGENLVVTQTMNSFVAMNTPTLEGEGLIDMNSAFLVIEPEPGENTDNTTTTSASGSQEANANQSIPQNEVSNGSSGGRDKDKDLCTICFLRTKTSAFVHKKVAHFCCCYSCGSKILRRNGRCPICRENILKVVKIINV